MLNIEAIRKQIISLEQDYQTIFFREVRSLVDLEKYRIEFLGRGGRVAGLTLAVGSFEDKIVRKKLGMAVNRVKQSAKELYDNKKRELSMVQDTLSAPEEILDVTQPALPPTRAGHYHPITIVERELADVFTSMGFMVLDGPELESDYYNFEALNIPPDHPARDIQDTFYIKGHPDWVMRTQTSNMQVRAMREYGAPLRVAVIGRVFRHEATDASHEHTFHQIEGLVVDEGISLAHLKGALLVMLKEILGAEIKIRLRPSYFPFVEPGVEIDVSCTLCKGAGCRTCKQTGWMELLGAGMVHPRVLEAGGVDPKRYTGFAFGTGIERLTMLKYGIEDIRHFYASELRFIEQF
ncbi:MAG: phenylalanine--tRNA ligase subunit alpha [Patescibacteria group bacterium]